MTTTKIQCITEEAHAQVIKILDEKGIKYTAHLVDGWGLHSNVHVFAQDIKNLLENVKDTKTNNHD